MKIRVKSDEFQKELQLIQGIIERKTTIPILSNLLLRVDKTNIEIEATDLEIGLNCRSAGDISEPGIITVNARKLFDLVRSLPDMTLNLELIDNKNLQITGENVHYRIPILPADEYPGIPDADLKTVSKIPAGLLREAISKTIIASAVDDTRYTLNGIYTIINKDGVTLVATDAHRLATFTFKTKIDNIDEEVDFILPRKGAQEILNLIKDAKDEDSLEFKADNNNIFFRFNDRLLISRVIEGRYPQYEKVIPKENDKELIFKREEILHVLNRIDLVASEKSHAIMLSLESSKVKINSSSPEFGEGEEVIDISFDGDEMKIAFNARYMIDFLSNTDKEKVKLVLKDSKTAGILQEEDNENYTYVVSPIKL